MHNLFQFISKYHYFLLFLLLEVTALFMVIQNSHFQRSSFINSTNIASSRVYATVSNWQEYFSLSETNDLLILENSKLKSLLSLQQRNSVASVNPLQFIPAIVINNSVSRANNYITLDKGRLNGIKKGMGVISKNGIIGIVKETSDHYSTALSVLHSKSKVSVKMKKNNHLGSLEWKGNSYLYASVKDIPSHVKASVGDTISTSGFSSTYPNNIAIGTISKVKTKPNDNFHRIEIRFIENFKELNYVEICKLILAEEKYKLESKNDE